MVSAVRWSMGNLVNIAKARQKNEFDVIQFWSGARGNGKSTGAFKFCSRWDCFKPWRDIVYSRNDVMKFMESRINMVILDDEAVRTGYKRNFYEEDQKKLIAIVNMYRDNYNIYNGCIPNFYDLDKDLRNLCTIHIHVIGRGMAVVHLPKKDKLYSNDPWDVVYNSKIEINWNQKSKNDPKFSPPFYKLTTFAGYLFYNKLTPLQEQLYKKIKRTKRKIVYDNEMNGAKDKTINIYDNMLKLVKGGFLDKSKLKAICLANDISIVNARVNLNRMLNEETHGKTLNQFLIDNKPTTRKLINSTSEKIPFSRVV